MLSFFPVTQKLDNAGTENGWVDLLPKKTHNCVTQLTDLNHVINILVWFCGRNAYVNKYTCGWSCFFSRLEMLMSNEATHFIFEVLNLL